MQSSEKAFYSVFIGIERLVILLYDGTSTCTNVNIAIKQLFTKKDRSMERLPPTQAALHQHILRAAYQGGHIWGQMLDLSLSISSPDGWGRVQLDTGMSGILTFT